MLERLPSWPESVPRRLKLLYVSPGVLMDLFRQDDGRQVYFEGMPEDAQLVGVSDQFRFDRNLIGLKIESSTFPEVPAGCAISELEVKVTVKFPEVKTHGPEFL